MELQDLAHELVRDYLMAQLKDYSSNFWTDIECDTDVESLTPDEYSKLIEYIENVRLNVH